MGFPVILWGAEKLVPAEYGCPYGTAGQEFELWTSGMKVSGFMHSTTAASLAYSRVVHNLKF